MLLAAASTANGDRLQEFCGRLAMRRPQSGKVQPQRLAIDNPPLASDLDPVGRMAATEDQRGKRVVATREAQFIKRKQRETGLLSDCNNANVRSPQTARRPLRCPSHRDETRRPPSDSGAG
jgi:hypothetical protein